MSAQPDHTPAAPYAPAPGAPAELLAQLRADRRAERWVPAFEREWAAGARRAWYCAHLPLRADRSPAYAPGGSRDPALDEVDDVVDQWRELSSTQQRDRNATGSHDQA